MLYKLIVFIVLSLIPIGQAHAESASVLLGKAIEYYQGRKYHESILAFEKLRLHYQLNPRFTAYLGFSYYKEREYEDAVACLEESIPQLTAYSPFEQAIYLYACAESHFYLSQYRLALPYYQQALPLTTGLDAADINYHMAFCYYLDEELSTEIDTLDILGDSIETDSIKADSVDIKVMVLRKHFGIANRLYLEASKLHPLSPLHTARLSQTTNMLRALEPKKQ